MFIGGASIALHLEKISNLGRWKSNSNEEKKKNKDGRCFGAEIYESLSLISHLFPPILINWYAGYNIFNTSSRYKWSLKIFNIVSLRFA